MNLDKKLEQRLKDNYEKGQKSLDRETAHLLKAYVSSLRILFGAFNSGDIQESDFVTVLRSMQNSSPLDIDGYIRNSDPYRKMIRPPKDKMIKIVSESGRKILLIDDEYDSVGWNLVFDALFGNGNVVYAKDGVEALMHLEKHPIGLILLDLNLPSEPRQGIELLQQIVEKRLDIPIIPFTGEDTVKYQRKCFSEGAFDYFVKEFKEEDKNYLTYYEVFRAMLISALSLSRKGDIWRNITILEEHIQLQGPPYFRDTIHYLKKGYYFLTLDSENKMSSILLSYNNITHFAEVLIQCALASESIINGLVNEKKNDQFVKLLLKQNKTLSFGQKLNALRTIKLLDGGMVASLENVNAMRIKCVHPDSRGLHITEEQATSLIRETVNIITRTIQNHFSGRS